MSNKVFANGREISCKAAAGKTICAMPDVCFTPPENPATPPGVPIPYPNTGMASDTTDGSKSVKISDKEVGLKNKSCFKKSTGDEAGSAAKKGVITSKNTGKVYFNAWSMDVKIEGQNAVRHLDLTTNNHASKPGDTPPWLYKDSQDVAEPLPAASSKCNHDWDCTPIPKKKKKKSSAGQAGDAFEKKALDHNKDDIKSEDDVNPSFDCNKCPTRKEVDHITRDDKGNITKVVEVKSDHSVAAGGASRKGININTKQLREGRKIVASINECQKDSGVEAKLEYKLEDGKAALEAEKFLLKKDPPIVTRI